MRVTVLGQGQMGRAVATRLLRQGHSVTVWNRTAERTAELRDLGATVAPTVEEAVQGADVVMTSLANDAAVLQVCLEGGAIEALPDGAVLIDVSTVHPETSRQLAAAAPEGRFVDAPILGSPIGVLNGRARLLLAGKREVVHGLDALWHDLGAGSVYTGPNGTASTLKLLSNLILVGGTVLLMEAVVTAQASGFDDAVLREAFGQSPAVADGVRARLEDILHGDHHGWWTLQLADKDLSLVLKLGQEARRDLPLATATEGIIRQSIDAGYGDLDLGAITELLRQA